MFDVWVGGTNIAPFLWLFALIVIFPLQIILCFKAKNKVVRLLPVIIFSALTAAAIIAVAVSIDWSALFYLIFAVYFAIMLLFCGAAWLTWFIVKKLKAKNAIKSDTAVTE